MKRLKTLLFVVLICISMSFTSFAHSGRTDSNGGHHDYKNQSGLGSYHYHCGGNPPHLHPNGACPYASGNSNNYFSPSIPEVPSIKVNNAPKTLGIGESIILDYSWNNTLKDTREITSSNEKIIKVLDKDTLEAISEGEATITVKTDNAETSFTVKVKPIMATSIEISNTINKLQLDTDFQFKYNIKPNNTTDKTVTWKSSNPNIATVDAESGKVEAKKVGNVVITCTTSNGIKQDIPITIYEVFPQSIETNLDKFNIETLDIECTKPYRLNVSILPDNANNKTYRLYVENNNIAQITNTNTITGLNDGDTNIIIRTHNGITKTIPLHIYHIPTTDIELDQSSIECIISTSKIKIIDTDQVLSIDYNIAPDTATYQDITWESSNNEIIKPENNILNVVGTGNVELTARTYDGQSETIKLYVINFSSVIALFIICLGSGVCYIIIWYKYKHENNRLN